MTQASVSYRNGIFTFKTANSTEPTSLNQGLTLVGEKSSTILQFVIDFTTKVPCNLDFTHSYLISGIKYDGTMVTFLCPSNHHMCSLSMEKEMIVHYDECRDHVLNFCKELQG